MIDEKLHPMILLMWKLTLEWWFLIQNYTLTHQSTLQVSWQVHFIIYNLY